MMPTWSQVVDMFKELCLPVCDDEKEIRDAFERKRDAYVREAGSPNLVRAEKARTHMKNAQALISNSSRPPLLGVIYASLEMDLNGLLAALPSGVVTARLRAPLLAMAINRYYCRPDLAEQWVDRLTP
jgi:hypothetical protein